MVRAIALFSCALLAACASTPPEERVNYSFDEQLQRANVAYEQARLQDAEQIYRSITDTHPYLKDVWFRLGNIYTRENQLDAAIRAYEKALQLDLNDGRSWYNLSLVYLKKSVSTLEAALQTLPPDSPYRKQLAELHNSLLERSSTKGGDGHD
jgi:tetratricopeptide (TPR) repeat protein